MIDLSNPAWGFTGTRIGLTATQQDWLIDAFPMGVTIHHGGCVGADEMMHLYAINALSSVVVHPPTNPTLRMQYDSRALWLPAKDYLDRDRDIVDCAEVLLAAPDGPERGKSGTWYTVRYAVKTGKPVRICYPDGTVESR